MKCDKGDEFEALCKSLGYDPVPRPEADEAPRPKRVRPAATTAARVPQVDQPLAKSFDVRCAEAIQADAVHPWHFGSLGTVGGALVGKPSN